jgi:hypothetical protein
MRTLFTLLLSCTSLLAGGQDVQVMTSTNDAVNTTTEIYTREGNTNLVRQTTTKSGVVIFRLQTFYQDGSKVATSLLAASPPTYISQFFTEPNTHYLASLQFDPSNHITFLIIGSNVTSVVDAFTCTNGSFYPATAAEIAELNAFSKKTERQSRVSQSPIF